MEVGKFADFIILDRDILKVAENQLLGTKVLNTYVNGEKVY
jgi:predicted amidohydrolase YtcJ